MEIRRNPVGYTNGNTSQVPSLVEAYTLDVGGGFAADIWTFGASLIRFQCPDRKNQVENVVLNLPDLDSYQNRSKNQYIGATVGRFARCIGFGRFDLDGVTYQLDRNNGDHHFHGGTIGFDQLVWQAEASREGDKLRLNLSLFRPEFDQGYPGAVRAEAIYTLANTGVLEIEYKVNTTKPTIVGLTNHSYWNLQSSGTIDGHELLVNSARVVSTNGEFIPDGSVESVSNSTLDFRHSKQIKGTKFDHCFVLEHDGWAAELFDPISGRSMRLVTNQSALAIYSGDSLAKTRSALCLQPTGWPDAPNRPEFPSARLNPDQYYHYRSTYVFSVR
jgi:aldose 1-epimerase